jgi:hypothetical protein
MRANRAGLFTCKRKVTENTTALAVTSLIVNY